jgi:hypothetical protein
MRRGGFLLLIAAAGACADEAPMRFEMPGILRQALTGVSELEARAQLVPTGGAPLPELALKSGDDGVTFTGFIPAAPGEYVLEIAFTGTFAGSPGRIFLGRWSSDVFTVTRGNAAQANFSRPIDALGRPADRGDLDSDGLANLEEILARTDPGLADTDMDTLDDGDDCDPADRMKSVRIAVGGNMLDCDADSYVRRDPPYGARGDDCNDGDGDVHPGAMDRCDDDVDSDCDPTSCPVDDMNVPMVSDFRPLAGTPVGCQARISAVIRDDSMVTYGLLSFPDDPYPNGTERLLLMNAPAQGDRWESTQIQDATGVDPVPEGTRRIQVRATDNHGNTGTAEHMITLAYGSPRITSMTPEQLPPATGQVDVFINSTVVHGTPHVRLYAATRGGDGFFHGTNAVIVAEADGGQATLSIDTSQLSAGEYLLFPVVSDDVGNELTPYLTGILSSPMTAYYPCIVGTQEEIPTRVLMVGDTPFTAATMRELLPRALSEAAAIDPAARLTQIVGLGVGADGKVQLDSTTRYTPRWSFGFYNSTRAEWIDVSWLTFAHGRQNPVVTPNAGSVSSTDLIADPEAMIDSDRGVALFAAEANCPDLTGDDNDMVQYLRDADTSQDVIMIGAMSKYWRATAAEPPSTIFTCQP